MEVEETSSSGAGPLPASSRSSGGVDSHFHLYRLAAMIPGLPRKGATCPAIILNRAEGGSVPRGRILLHMVASVCDREKLIALSSDDSPHWADLEVDGRVVLAVGVHPKHCRSADQATRDAILLRGLLCRERVVALGEVGLDSSAGARSSVEVQTAYLRALLQGLIDVLVPEQGAPIPVVLHYRGFSSSALVGDQLRQLLQELLPSSHPLQLHYFCGGPGEVAQWKAAFPNAFFSVGGALLSRPSQMQLDGVSAVPLDRLLLESDAPADPAARPGHRRAYDTPYVIWDVAASVAEIRGVAPEEILEASTGNARRLFSLAAPSC